MSRLLSLLWLGRPFVWIFSDMIGLQRFMSGRSFVAASKALVGWSKTKLINDTDEYFASSTPTEQQPIFGSPDIFKVRFMTVFNASHQQMELALLHCCTLCQLASRAELAVKPFCPRVGREPPVTRDPYPACFRSFFTPNTHDSTDHDRFRLLQSLRMSWSIESGVLK